MNRKYHLLIIPAVFACVLLFFSCRKSLDLSPLDTLSEAQFFKSGNDFKLFANQFYTSLPTYNTEDNNSDISMQIGSFNNISNSSYAPPAADGDWNNNYSIVWQTSYLIEKVSLAAGDLKSAIGKYEGEARFFRAFAYYKLLKKFGGVPLVDKALTESDADIIYGPRNSREDVMNFMLEDLNKAISLLPEESDIAIGDKGRISKGAALALKARVALFEGTWRKYHNVGGNASDLLQQAVDACNLIFASNQYELFDRRDVLGDSSYRFFFILDKKVSNPAGLTKADQRETILPRRYDPDIAGSPGAARPSPTKKMADMFLCKDGLPIDRSPLFRGYDMALDEYIDRDPRMYNDFIKPFQHFWFYSQPLYYRDWSNPTAGGLDNNVEFGFEFTQTGYTSHKFAQEIQPPFGTEYPVFRLAEIYLIYAEALYEMNGSISDGDLDLSINKLRHRVGMPSLTNSFVSDNGLDMQTEIRRERTVELYMEGFRFDDLRRWKTAEVEMSMPLRGIKYTGTQYATDPRWSTLVFTTDAEGYIILEEASKRQFKQRNYLFPLPLRQTIINTELDQNPDW